MISVLAYVAAVNLVFIATPAAGAGRGSSCFTPNNERATCLPVNSCKVLKDAIATRNSSAIDFARKSQCGYDTEPLVCCGTTGYPVSTLVFDIFSTSSQPSSAVKPFEHRLLPDKSVCGLERHENKVYGGQMTDLDEFPWMTLLRYRDGFGNDAGFRCGGTLINPRYVLTAAHCVSLSSNAGLVLYEMDAVRLGEWKISATRDCLGAQGLEECSNPVVDLGIEEIIPHSDYNRRTRENDIALLRLRRNTAYTDFIRPICIPPPDSLPPRNGSYLIVAGWGATENSSTSDVKLKVQVPLVSQAECASRIGQRGKVTENQICAGGVKGRDSCQGDSGGPLMRMEESSSSQPQWFQEGIISFGIGCGVAGFPGIYVRVAKYSNWIVDNMLDY